MPRETVDLRGTLRFNGVNRIVDLTEIRRNDSIAKATPLLHLPFDSANPAFATVIEPERDDVDFYSFRVRAGDILAIEVVRGNLDSVIGVFDADTGELLVTDDDGGNGLLSRLLLQADADLRLAVAVSTFPDLEFVGAGETNGRYSLYINTYRGTPIEIGDDDTVPVTLARPFNFQGQARSSVFVNSNGSLSFGAGDTSFLATVPAFLAGPPRISPLWTDLDPTGFLGNPGVVVVDANARPAAVHFVSVSQFFSSNPNYFTAELRDQGGIALKWGPTARGAGLVGVTQGGGAADPGPTRPEQARTASDRDHVRELPVQHLDARGQQLRPLLRRDQEQIAVGEEMTLAKTHKIAKKNLNISEILLGVLGVLARDLSVTAPRRASCRKLRNSRRVRGPYVANDGFGASAYATRLRATASPSVSRRMSAGER